MKRCTACKVDKPLSDFWAARAGRHGKQSQCKACKRAYVAANREKIRARAAQAYLRDKRSHAAKGRAAHLRRKYGITEGQYAAMLRRQGGLCAICKATPNGRSFPVDHDHITGLVRAILCDRCNRLIGLADEDAQVLTAAAAYVIGAKAPASTFWGPPNEDPEALPSPGVRIEIEQIVA